MKEIGTIVLRGFAVAAVFLMCLFTVCQFWWLFIIVGSLLTIASFFVPASIKTEFRESFVEDLNSMGQKPFVIPQSWNLNEIGIQVRSLRRNPNVLKIFVDSVVERFITGQDDRTAQKRIAFLRTKLEELGLAKDIQASLDDLEFRQLKLDIRRTELEIQKEGLEDKKAKQRDLSELRHRLETLKVNAEIAVLEKQISDLQKPGQMQPERSPEEINKERREQANLKIEKLNADDKAIDDNPDMDPREKMRRKNMNEKRRNECFDELERYP
jgi:hypothetical protein